VSSQMTGERARRTAGVATTRIGSTAARAAAVRAGYGAAAANRAEPAPTPRRLAGLCGWAALLGFLGVVVGARGLIAVIVKAPQWYLPMLIAFGLGGIGLTVVAFLTVHQRLVPWLFLTLASAVLLAAIVATALAT
jgi:hypothetical protein